jgi:hypothetical protein
VAVEGVEDVNESFADQLLQRGFDVQGSPAALRGDGPLRDSYQMSWPWGPSGRGRRGAGADDQARRLVRL